MGEGEIMGLQTWRRAAIAAVLAVAGLPVWASAANPPLPADPAAVVEAFHGAISAGDTATAAAQLADEAVVYEQGHAERTKAQYVAEHLPADAAYSKGVAEDVRSRVVREAGQLAYVITEGRTTGVAGANPVDRLTTETMILRRTGSGWLIVHIHWSSSAAPKPAP